MPQEVVQLNKKVFTVNYRNHDCKIGVMMALNAYPGISAQNDLNHGKLLRCVTVTLTGNIDFGIPRGMLQAVGSVKDEKAVFTVTFRDSTRKREALAAVNARRDVVVARFPPVYNSVSAYGPTVPSTLYVFGGANPRTVLGLLRQYGTARFA